MDLSNFYNAFAIISKVVKYDNLEFIVSDLNVNNTSQDSIKRMEKEYRGEFDANKSQSEMAFVLMEKS